MIEIRELTKRYGDRAAVDRLSFGAPAGQVTGLLGPNGAGKTTTFRCLLGLAQPTSGAALVNGRRYGDLDHPRREIGALFESTGFHPARTGRNHLRVIARAAGIDATRIDQLLEVVGLRSAADRRVGGYSLGMRQRLGLAGALLGDPPIIVLDEPANGLDPEGIAWVRQLLRAWADEGRCVVVASHVLAEVAQIVDRVVIIRDGRLVEETELATLGEAVIVRVDRPDAMVEALAVEGVQHEVLASGAIVVRGRDSAEVGALAARARVVVTELARRSPGETLEERFLAAVGGGR